MKNGKKILLFMILILVILLATVNFFLYQRINNPVRRAEEQLDLGRQYLLDMEYEEAVAAFEAVIALEPKNVDAYLGMAEAYLSMGEEEKAIRILKRGYRETQDEELGSLLDELEAAQNRKEADVRIVQIDTNAFPAVTVYFSVEDTAGNIIGDIRAEQIEVLEENGGEWTKMEGSLQFSQEDTSRRSVAMAMDVSGSMYGSLDQLCAAAQELLGQMQGGNYDVSLTAFDDRQYPLVDYTDDLSAVHGALDGLAAGGGTAFYDTLEYCLYQSVNQQGQKYVLAFTDGADGDSSISKEGLISLANYYHVPIYIITSLDQNYWTQDMEEIARESGGGFYVVSSMDDLYAIYYEIFQLQENLYSFQYTTKQSDTECGLRVLYKSVHFDGSSEGDFISQKPVPREWVDNSAVMGAKASSERQGSPLDNAFDADDGTMWAEGVRGNGIGEWIEITLDEAHKLNGIRIDNGSRTNSDLYEKHGRVKTIKVTFSDGSQRQYELKDDFYEPCQVNFINPVRTSSLKIEILDVYEGTTYQDTCITGICIF